MSRNPVVALVVGKAISGGFLAHGLQAHRLLALDTPGVMVHAIPKGIGRARHAALGPEEIGRAMGRVVMRGNPKSNNVTWSPCGRRGGRQILMSWGDLHDRPGSGR